MSTAHKVWAKGGGLLAVAIAAATSAVAPPTMPPDLLTGMDLCAGGVEAPRLAVPAVHPGALLMTCIRRATSTDDLAGRPPAAGPLRVRRPARRAGPDGAARPG